MCKCCGLAGSWINCCGCWFCCWFLLILSLPLVRVQLHLLFLPFLLYIIPSLTLNYSFLILLCHAVYFLTFLSFTLPYVHFPLFLFALLLISIPDVINLMLPFLKFQLMLEFDNSLSYFILVWQWIWQLGYLLLSYSLILGIPFSYFFGILDKPHVMYGSAVWFLSLSRGIGSHILLLYMCTMIHNTHLWFP